MGMLLASVKRMEAHLTAAALKPVTVFPSPYLIEIFDLEGRTTICWL